MSMRRALPAALVTCLVMASPAAAAPTITADQACYTPGMAQHITGSGFTASGPVRLEMYVSAGNILEILGELTTVADAAGAIDVQARTPEFEQERGSAIIVAIDGTLESQGATPDQFSFALSVEASQWEVGVARWGSPARGKPGRRSKVTAIGWVGTASTTLYAHYVRGGKLAKTVRVGDLAGACADFSGRMKEFPFRAKAANYRVIFDTTRAYPNEDANITYRRVKVARADAVRAMAAIADPLERLRTGDRGLVYR